MTKHNEPLPPCACGASTWHDHGCSIGGPLAQFGKRCGGCSRVAQEIHHAGGALFIVPIGETFGPTLDAWFNGPVMAVLRTRGMAFDAALSERRLITLALVNVEMGLPVGTKGDTVPDHLRREWGSALDTLDGEARDEVRARAEFRDAPMPPRVPSDVLCYARSADGWVRRTTEETANVEAPVDPIRLAHNATFARIFDDVRKSAAVWFTVREIPNRYYRDDSNIEPWFAFEIRDVAFVVGPRKSVISIEAKNLPRSRIANVARLAERDKVTYEGGGGRVLIHAYGAVNAIEYIATMIRGATIATAILGGAS